MPDSLQRIIVGGFCLLVMVVFLGGMWWLGEEDARFKTLRSPPHGWAMRYIQNAGGIGGLPEGKDCLVDFDRGQFVEVGVLGDHIIMRYTPTRDQAYQCPASTLIEQEPAALEEYYLAREKKRAFQAEREALTRKSLALE